MHTCWRHWSTDGQRLTVLLTYLDLPGFQAVCTALDTYQTTYSDVKTFLISRYSSCDIFMEQLNFIEAKYSWLPENYAASLCSYMDKLSSSATTLREEEKFITSTSGSLSSELKLRRPTTLNECVKRANSIGPSSVCATVHDVRNTSKFRNRKGPVSQKNTYTKNFPPL